jgi:hypothetical protein
MENASTNPQTKSSGEPLRNWFANNLQFMNAFRGNGKDASGAMMSPASISAAAPKSTWNRFYVTNFDINVVGPTSW